jgi:iron-sulfur cluster assembly protein
MESPWKFLGLSPGDHRAFRRQPSGLQFRHPGMREVSPPASTRSYPMSIMLTEKAASEVKKIITEQKLAPETVLRVGVAGGGCSGFSYSLGFDTAFDPKADSKTEQHGIAVVVDKKSDLFLDGTTLDFHDAIDKRGFTFNNPNAKKTCGCGSSFQA